MRIGVDLRFTAKSHMGTGAYAEWAALELLDALDSTTDELIGFGTVAQTPFATEKPMRWVQVPTNMACGDSELQYRLLLDAAIARSRVDVFFSPTGLSPLSKTCPVVITVHDLLFERNPEFFSLPLLAHLKREISWSVRIADGIIAISEFTRNDLMHIYGAASDRISVVHQGLRRIFRHRPSASDIENCLTSHGIQRPYIFVLSNHAPHKNTAFALDVFDRWTKRTRNNRHCLVIAGGGPAPQVTTDLDALIRRSGLANRVKLLDRVDDSALPSLYAGADAFLFPSKFEGWGLPPLEAIAMGVPTLVSNCGALPEAVADAGVVLSLDEPDRWVKSLDSLSIASVRAELQEKMNVRRTRLFAQQGACLRACLSTLITVGPVMATKMEVQKTELSNSNRDLFLSGCMVVKNGKRLGYPFIEAVMSVIDYVDEMVIVDGKSDDETWSILSEMARLCSKIILKLEGWPNVSTGGQVIALATNSALKHCRGTHILYLQADEIHSDANMNRLRELLSQGYDSAAFPFLHFRTSWWSVLSNPAYVAAIRCVPNRPGVESVLDGVSFGGPLAPCAPPNLFADCIYHTGWVYAKNSIEKHVNHARIYSDNPIYIEKARKATKAKEDEWPSLAAIDDDYQLTAFQGKHPSVVHHLLELTEYKHEQGLRIWKQKFSES